nr:uncharacterized protein CI109_000317 [Kwoniella shandongensis]KAA5531475.1 hypothetical protein CI109_000317 [Kwoniella shandongensis]
MSILTPSRGDYQTTLHHNPLFASVSASAAASTSTAPVSVAIQHPLPPTTNNANSTKMESLSRSNVKSLGGGKQDGHGHFDVFNTWRKGASAAAGTSSNPNATSREILATVNTNLVGSGSKARITSIPKPSATPDVFAAEMVTNNSKSSLYNSTSAQTFSLSRNGSAKRSRDMTSTSMMISTKRAKVEGITDVTTASANAKQSGRMMEEQQWRDKWTRAFPNLVFHFEIGAEEGPGRNMRNRVLKMGAKVDQFFSTRVTHLIVKGGNSPQKAKPLAPTRRGDNAVRESPKNPFLDGTGVTDLVQKAEAMNMKVWTVKKLAGILSRIAPVETNNTNDTLSTMLEDERIHGTRERDLTAPRPDYYYFKPGSKYLLIEDATGKHRTIMVKEYSYSQKDGPEWPTLFDGFLRISSSMQSTVPVEKIRDRAWTLYVDRRPFGSEQPPHELKPSTSLRALPSTPKLPEAQPYHDASGNSVVLTSNIASTSAANTPNFGGLNGLPGLGGSKDRAIMQMSKRVQVLKGNARLAASKRTPTNDNEFDYPSAFPTAGSGSIPERRHSMGGSGGFAQPPKTFMTQEQVIKMLQQARDPVQDPSITVQMRMRNREKVDMGLKGRDQDTAAGYCENCRLRYSDLSVHMASKKHRRFATNDENFEELDRLLYTLQRPLHPTSVIMRYPPCNERHEKDADCVKCCVDMASDDGVENGGSSEEEVETGDDDEEGTEVTDEDGEYLE